MHSADVTSLRKRLLLAAGVLAAVAIHGGSRARAASGVETVCIPPEATGACAADDVAVARIGENNPERCPPSLAKPGATLTDGACCYEVTFECEPVVVGCSYTGRPLILEDRPLSTGTRRIASFLDDSLPRPDLTGSSQEERRSAAMHWARIGAAEYTSIAGFQRFAMDLLANGAPPELLSGATRAAADELRHARLAFTFASVFAGGPVGPGELTLPPAIPIHRTLSELACATAHEGCTVETLSACLLAEARMHATDPAIRRALGRMLRDEERHSALAWRTLRWALSVDPTVAPAAREALDRAIAALTTEGFSHEADLSRFGVLRPADARACLQTAIREVIVPCRDAIFGEGDERRA